ncbi:MAG: helix-hairpin-helix domain-containing protein [Ktedonobacteraceae bacterium]
MIKVAQLILDVDISLGAELARGGEGTIYKIRNDPSSVAKIFHKPSKEKADKIQAMISNPPHDTAERDLGHTSIAWPKACIMNANQQCVGFTMPYIYIDESHKYHPLFVAYNPQTRLKTIAALTWDYLLLIAHNVAFIVKELHDKGYVIGDINESNFLFTNTGLVTLVDCDSVQAPKPGGGFYRCTVGKPEFTAPELQGKNLSQVDRQRYSDDFSLAILIFLLLMEGRHPFSGVWRGESNPPTIPQHIQQGNFPYAKPLALPFTKNTNHLFPPVHALPFEILPPNVQRLMISCFRTNHHSEGSRHPKERPTAQRWYQVLEEAEKQLVACRKYPSSHVYRKGLSQCPWCQRAELLGTNPFPTIGPPSGEPDRENIMVGIFTTLIVLATIALYLAEYHFWPIYGHILGPLFIAIILVGGPLLLCILLVRRLWKS